MSKHEDKLEQKSLAKAEIKKDSGALDDKDLEKVTGGDKAAPKETVKESVGFAFSRIEYNYTNQ